VFDKNRRVKYEKVKGRFFIILKKKRWRFFSIISFSLIFALAQPCFAELTEKNVRQIIREEIEPVKIDIAEMKGGIKSLGDKMTTLEGKMTMLEGKMATLEGKMATKNDIITVKDDIIAMQRNLREGMETLYGVLIGILVAIIVAILSIILSPFLRKWFEGREQKEDIMRLKDELEELKKMIMAKGEGK